ncbi:MAG TPA: metal-dependent transcriptional regulator [Phycisphaeraceae bacterium]
MPSSTVENYLKQIYLWQQDNDFQRMPMGQLALSLNVAPGTVTSMVKALADAQLVDYTPRGGVQLTPQGTRLALQVLRRHRLIEKFLVEVLQLDWSEVHDEAEELEHAISDKVLERIDALLGYPDTDPHGDPIPPAEGHPESRELASLADCPVDDTFRVARVIDQSVEFLQFVDQQGLAPGSDVTVESRSNSAQAVTLRPAGRQAVTMGTAAAAKILVSPVPADKPSAAQTP